MNLTTNDRAELLVLQKKRAIILMLPLIIVSLFLSAIGISTIVNSKTTEIININEISYTDILAKSQSDDENVDIIYYVHNLEVIDSLYNLGKDLDSDLLHLLFFSQESYLVRFKDVNGVTVYSAFDTTYFRDNDLLDLKRQLEKHFNDTKTDKEPMIISGTFEITKYHDHQLARIYEIVSKDAPGETISDYYTICYRGKTVSEEQFSNHLPLFLMILFNSGLYLLSFFVIKDITKLVSTLLRMKKYKDREIEQNKQLDFIRVMENYGKTVKKNMLIITAFILLGVLMAVLSIKIDVRLIYPAINILLCSLIYLCIYLFRGITKLNFFKGLDLDRVELLAADINLDFPTFSNTEIYCGEKAFYCAKDNALIAYEDVRWIYTEKDPVSTYFSSGLELVIKTIDGQTYYIHYNSAEIKYLILGFIAPASPNILVGATVENEKIYLDERKAYRKANKK